MTVGGVLLPLVFYGGLNYGDYRSSIDAQKRGGVEIGFIDPNGPIEKPAKIVGTLLLTGLDVALQQDKRNRAGLWVYRIAVGGIYTALIIHNHGVNRK